MRILTVMVVSGLLLGSATEARADRFKAYRSGGSRVTVGPGSRWIRPSPYSGGGGAKTVFSFTTSPLWALAGLAKVKGELRLADRLSVAIQALGGYSVPHAAPTLGVGAQASVYVAGNYDRGWVLGLNTMRIGSMMQPAEVATSSWDITDGVFLGWKSTAADKTVLELQLGAQRWQRGGASPWGAAEPSYIPTLGLNYGWAR